MAVIAEAKATARRAAGRLDAGGELVLIRGLPGSGKSTMAHAMAGFEHFEADQFFMRDGAYLFAETKLSEAHAWCVARATDALLRGAKVVVANTFARRSEMVPYLRAAMVAGVPCRILVATGTFESVHEVPPERMARLREQWEP